MTQDASSRKCSLRVVGGCKGKLTREHYVSRAIIKNISKGGSVRIIGAPWMSGKELVTGEGALTAKIYCERHNGLLSKFDDEAGRFLEAIQDGPRDIGAGTEKSGTHTFNGDRLERWMFKTAFGFWVAGLGGMNGTARATEPSDHWRRMMVDDSPFPPGWGMYIGASSTPITVVENEFSIQPLTLNDGQIAAVKIELCKIVLYFTIGHPLGVDEFEHYRPAHLSFGNSKAKRTLRLSGT